MIPGAIIKGPKGRYFRVKSKLDDAMDLEVLSKEDSRKYEQLARLNRIMPEYAPPRMYCYTPDATATVMNTKRFEE